MDMGETTNMFLIVLAMMAVVGIGGLVLNDMKNTITINCCGTGAVLSPDGKECISTMPLGGSIPSNCTITTIENAVV